jgi:hypothetical protein
MRSKLSTANSPETRNPAARSQDASRKPVTVVGSSESQRCRESHFFRSRALQGYDEIDRTVDDLKRRGVWKE